MKYLFTTAALLAMVGTASAKWVWVPSSPAYTCTVADPTDTPLNVRSSPSGRNLGALKNGTTVTISSKVLSRPWVYAVSEVGKSG